MSEPERRPGRSIELREAEVVVPHGTRTDLWYVREDRRWTRASRIAGAVVETRDSGPGTVWARSVTLVLTPGAELMLIRAGPKASARQDPMAYLRREARGADRKLRKSLYRLSRDGTLIAITARTAPPERR